MLFLARTRQGERNVRCSAGCRCQGVVCVWVTDWLTVPVPGYSKLYVLLYSVLFSRLNSFPAFVFSLRLQPLRCIPRATSICSFWDFGLLLGCVWVQVGLGSFGVSRSWHCTGEQEEQQHALEKQANNEANLFLFFLFFYYYVFFLDVLSSFLYNFSWGCCVFFHVTEPTALYYKTLEIFNMNLPFFLVIYNIILTVFCLIVFSDPIIVSPTPGAALSLNSWKMTTKKHRGAWKCFVRNGIKISLTKCFIWMAKACYTPRSLARKNMRLSLLLQENFGFFFSKCLK